MAYVYKEYENKIIIVQEQLLHLKMVFLLGYNMKIVKIWGDTPFMGKTKIWWMSHWVKIFPGGRIWPNFWLVAGFSLLGDGGGKSSLPAENLVIPLSTKKNPPNLIFIPLLNNNL